MEGVTNISGALFGGTLASGFRTAVVLTAGLVLFWAMACGREETEVVIALAAEDGSGQGGTATLTRQKAQTQVFIKVNPAPQGDDPQPVHIHFGSCGANLGAVDVSLNDIVAGESVTLANASLSSLRSGSRVINVHRSYDEISIYSACGGIPNN